MKFKKDGSGDPTRRLRIADKWRDTVRVDVEEDGKMLWIITENDGEKRAGPLVKVSRSKAIKLAWAILDELQPFNL